MGLKKYEIITVGGDKRVRALRSWQVGDRYVNIGDVGGIVYDEKTLSQDGACWLFRGNFGFPGARIGGDSIVDVGETTLSTIGSPNVDILGSSTFVGGPVRFFSDQTATEAMTLTAADFEQGTINYSAGVNWENMKVQSTQYIRTKSPIFMGGVATTLKLDVPGYTVQAYVLDRDGIGLTAAASTNTGEDVTLAIPAGQYFVLCLSKSPVGRIVPADATAAQIKFKWTYETKLDIVDSRLELNPANSTGPITIRPGGHPAIRIGAKYPNSVIRDSKVAINGSATGGRAVRLMAEFTNVNATIDSSAGDSNAMGVYSNVKNLTFSGVLTGSTGEAIPSAIQAYDCDNMVISPVNFPGLAAMYTAGVPIKFYGCNLNNGRFYHHAQIANTYRDINFDLATADLGKTTAKSEVVLVSSEVNGMYRLCAPAGSGFGGLVENHESVKSFSPAVVSTMYDTTIYADAYLNGIFDLAGTNVFGNTMKHDASNTQNVLAVQGFFNTNAAGGIITGYAPATDRVVVAQPYRLMGRKGIEVITPTGIEAVIFLTDANSKIVSNTAWVSGALSPNAAAATANVFAYVAFRKVGSTPITPDDVKGVTITTYNGCKIVNTGEAAIPMKGDIRVEDNATLVNASVTGSGYFGGNAVASSLSIAGSGFMKDNASFIRTAASGPIRDLKMTENAYAVLGDFTLNGRIHLSDNSVFTPTAAGLSEGDLVMKDNAVVSGAVTIGGVLTMKDNAKVSAGALSTYGDITLCGSYNQTAAKTWKGKRVIDSQDAPLYDNNVKTKYDI